MTRVVQRLAARRADAFRAADASRLGGVDEPGSAALASDTALVRRLAARRIRLEGLRYDVRSVVVTGRRGNETTVRAEVATSAHRQVGTGAPGLTGTGGPARTGTAVPAQRPRIVELRLVRDDRHGWLVRDVTG